jgi:hypothetical protein
MADLLIWMNVQYDDGGYYGLSYFSRALEPLRRPLLCKISLPSARSYSSPSSRTRATALLFDRFKLRTGVSAITTPTKPGVSGYHA